MTHPVLVKVPVEKKLKTDITGKPAPKPLEIDIKIQGDTAFIDSQIRENVGAGNSQVIFKTNKACTLKFLNPNVFGTEKVLQPGPNPVSVKNNGTTEYEVWIEEQVMDLELPDGFDATLSLRPHLMPAVGGPIIVVP